MRILIIMDDHKFNPSSHIRVLQYQRFFKSNKYVKIDISFRDIENKYFKKLSRILKYFLKIDIYLIFLKIKEYIISKKAKRYDLVYLVKVKSFSLFRRIKLNSNCKIIFDINDAIWLPASRHTGFFEYEKMFESTDIFFCENEYLADFIKKYSKVTLIQPDAPDIKKIKIPHCDVNLQKEIVICWVGTPSTSNSIFLIYNVLERLFCEYRNLKLLLLGCNEKKYRNFEFVNYKCIEYYDNTILVNEMSNVDIAIYPMFKNTDSLYRGNLKTKIYMGFGKPSVIQNYGNSKNLIQNGDSGFLADTEEDWYKYLQILIKDEELRKRMGLRAKCIIENNFNSEIIYNKLIENFKLALES